MFSVIKIASETLTEQYNPSLFNYFYETYPQGFLVAEKAHKIIGFIVGVKTSINSARILMLSVSKPYRRQKIGSTLLKQFIEQITKEYVKNITLEVRTKNHEAIKFYEKHDFKITNKITKFYQNGEDAYVMEKTLF